MRHTSPAPQAQRQSPTSSQIPKPLESPRQQSFRRSQLLSPPPSASPPLRASTPPQRQSPQASIPLQRQSSPLLSLPALQASPSHQHQRPLSSTPQTQAVCATQTPDPIAVTRKVYKIRDMYLMAMFSSSGDHAIVYPFYSGFPKPSDGDLYVHTWGANPDTQVWARVEGIWKEGRSEMQHPYMPSHRLYRSSEDDRYRWVHKNTITTYKSQQKRLRRACKLFHCSCLRHLLTHKLAPAL